MGHNCLLGFRALDIDITIDGENWDFGLCRILQAVIPTGIVGGGQHDGIDFIVDELVECLNLLLLIIVLRRRIHQVEARILERLLQIVLVSGTEPAFRADGHEANRLLAAVIGFRSGI